MTAEGEWAVGVQRLHLADGAPGEAAFTVAGRRPTGPQQGFGRMWRKTYRAVVDGGTAPETAVAFWKEHFGELWPRTSVFQGTRLLVGETAPIRVRTGPGMHLSTGVLVLYSDDTSFTFMTPEGHVFAGWITFSAATVETGTQLEVAVLVRTNDPLYEAMWPLVRRGEDQHWTAVLSTLAHQLTGEAVEVARAAELVDRRVRWANWANVRHNAALRSTAWVLAVPWRAARVQRSIYP